MDTKLQELINNCNKMDKLMQKTGDNSAKSIREDIFPIVLVNKAGFDIKLYTNQCPTQPVLDINMSEGLEFLFDWGKSIGHLIVWVAYLYTNHQFDEKFDWKSNAKEQLKFVNKTIEGLYLIFNKLVSINKKVITNNPHDVPIEFYMSIESYIDSAQKVLVGFKSFIMDRLIDSKLDKSHVDDLIKSVSDYASYSMYAINFIIISRGTRILTKWREKLGREEWDKLQVVISSGVPDSGKYGSTRGNCYDGNFMAVLFKNLMNLDNFSNKVYIVPKSEIKIDSVYKVISEYQTAYRIATNKGFDQTYNIYTKMLKNSLEDGERALTYNFTNLAVQQLLSVKNSE